jgi:pyruvate formate-lyase activating enzyme-like uncharacterized protein
MTGNSAELRRKESLIEANIREYGYNYDSLSFPSADSADAFSAERDGILQWLQGKTEFGCLGTKLDCRNLSPGCRSCVEGMWSCLFINGRCNCACFYCPSPQEETGSPQTNGIPFNSAVDYAEYLAKLGFTGASLSGGEPLLTLDRTLEYLTAVRKRCGDGIHIWLYTNGALLNPEICKRLRDAGLDEIRFDIGAVRYNLKKVKVAVGTIPVVTVEIPAVPEDFNPMKDKLVEMADAGVNHLNLHQLRLTPHNFGKLVGRGYTFIHGEKVTVLESELAALRLVRHAVENGISLPVNYCSFPYKRRFQRAATRRRAALRVSDCHEEVTESGFIRSLAACGPRSLMDEMAGALDLSECNDGLWKVDRTSGKLFFPSRLWPHIRGKVRTFTVSYHEAALSLTAKPSGKEGEITLPSGKRIAAFRQPVFETLEIGRDVIEAILKGDVDTIPIEIRDFERVPSGLAEYF